MDFFQAEDAARRRSRWLLLAFAGAVAVETLVVYAVIGRQPRESTCAVNRAHANLGAVVGGILLKLRAGVLLCGPV